MSIWYQHDVIAMGDRQAIGKFFNLDPEEDIHYIDNFDFSFGQKNVPGLRLGKLVEQNPDLVFLVKSFTDYDTTFWLERFCVSENKHQSIFIARGHHDAYAGIEVNTKLAKQYAERFPFLMDKIQAGEREYNWRHFFVGVENPFRHAADMLSKADEYKETSSFAQDDIELDLSEPMEIDD